MHASRPILHILKRRLAHGGAEWRGYRFVYFTIFTSLVALCVEVVDIGLGLGLDINLREDKYIKTTTSYTIGHLVESIVGIPDCLEPPAVQVVG